MIKIWSWIEKNRFTVALPLVGALLFMIAVGCTPVVESPSRPGVMVSAPELADDFALWQMDTDRTAMQFQLAGEDIERQKAEQAAIYETITMLASGSVADWGGLVQLLIGGGLIGVVGDNIRKNGVIGGLKRNI